MLNIVLDNSQKTPESLFIIDSLINFVLLI